MRSIVFALAAVAALTACPSLSPLGDGQTACNNTVCAAGQYCFGPDLCVNGCTSDANCLDGTACVDINETTGEGVCENGTNDPGDEGEGEAVVDDTCDGYADHARACGLLASETAAIKLSCDQASADVQDAMIACNASTSCAEFRSCSGVECFSDDDCDGGHCLQRSEVVDPFADFPYTCR